MLDELYQQVIMDHYRQPRGRGHLPEPTITQEGYHPLCGDEITLDLCVEDDTITDIKFRGRGCSISQASASIMVEKLKGKALTEACDAIREVYALLKGDIEPDLETMGDISALSGVRKFPVRVKCATLAWHTLEEALKGLK